MNNKFFVKFNCLIAIGLLLFASSCKTVEPEKPAVSYNPPVFVPKPSVINLGIELKETAVEKLINDNTSALLYEDNSYDDNGGDNMKMKAWKKGKIDVSFSGNQIIYKVPLKLWLSVGFKVEQFGVEISNYRDVNAEISLSFKTTYSLKEDWTFATTTVLEKYEWISAPTVNVAGYDMPVKTIADYVMKSQKQTLGPLIDQGFKSAFNLKKMVQDTWENIQKPSLLSADYKLWLKVQPKEVIMTPLVTDKGVIKVSVGITTIAETAMGVMPAFTVNKNLPKLKMVKQTDNKFVINLYNEMTYPFLDSMARGMMLNQVFEKGRKKVIIKGISVYGNDNKVIVETLLAGSLKGKVYLAGKPVYNKETKMIELTDVDFDIKSKNVLIKSANWLYDGGFNRLIQDKVKFPIGDSLAKQRIDLEKTLSSTKLAPNVLMSGKIDRLDVEDLWLTPGALKVYVGCEGKLNVKMVDGKL